MAACGRAARVFIYAYGDRVVDSSWERTRGGVEHVSNLSVMKCSSASSQAVARLAARTMRLDCTIQDGQIWLADATHTVEVDLAPMNER